MKYIRLAFLLFFAIIIISCHSDNYEPGERKEFTVNGIDFAVRYIPPGRFMMGSPEDEPGRIRIETQHEVTLTRGYWMMETLVTQELYEAVMGENPSDFDDRSDNPVERVNWFDAVEFCKELSSLTGKRWRLPTEAEWERACRAGTSTPFSFGDRIDSSMANYARSFPYGDPEDDKYRERTTPVRYFEPNAWGLYDMHGNLWEWCADYMRDYTEESIRNPKGPRSGERRIIRGGAWNVGAGGIRSAYRRSFYPYDKHYSIGFRAVFN